MELLAFCSPLYEDVAANELRSAAALRVRRRLHDGVFLCEGDIAPDQTERLEAADLTFTRQIVAALRTVPLSGEADADVAAILDAATPEMLAAGNAYVCHPDGRTNDVLAELLAALRGRIATMAGHAERRALGVVVMGREAHVGLALRSAWPAGRPPFAARPELVSRAAFKLLEALDVFAIEARAGKRALDLGASPGGWTQVLAQRGLRVVAVDPGALDPRAVLPGVEVRRMLAQTYLAAAPAPVDLLVNDMRLDARESARIMREAGEVLAPDGIGLMTLKLPEQAPTAIMRQALATLRPRFPVQQTRCLYYNRHEVTALLRAPS